MTAVCIDDFALKKRHKYGTIMVDIETHQIIDMIESRNLDDVVAWLQSFPNLQVFSRDGSIIYRNSINKAHPTNLQVSDRFHILKNLTSYATDALKREVKNKISLKSSTPVTLSHSVSNLDAMNRQLTFEEKSKQALELISKGENKASVSKQLHMDIRTLNKLLNMTEDELKQLFCTKAMDDRNEKQARKMEQVNEVRQLINNGLNYTEVARETGLCRQTVKKYANDQFQIEHASLGTKRKSKLTPYYDEIHKRFEQGWMATKIAVHIQQMGCSATISTISHYVSKLKKQKNEDQSKSDHFIHTEFISRGKLLNLLFHPLELSTSITKEQFEKVCQQYPIVRTIYHLVWEFKDIFKYKKMDELPHWIEKTKKLNIREMNHFILGLERDLEAIQNAIIYDYNNGLAEGSINKVKVIKRIMYGRCSFSTLRSKVLMLEQLKHFN